MWSKLSERGVKKKMTERVRRLREISVSTNPSISMERARLYTEAYKKWEGTVSVPEMRALALRYFMENRSLYIERGELIVGKRRASAGCTVVP